MSNTNDSTTPKSNDNTVPKNNDSIIPKSNDNNTFQTMDISFNVSRIITQTPSNPRSSKRTPNPSRQHRNKRDSFNDLDYDPEEKIFKENPFHFVTPEYAQKCIDND
ncbi:14055_t:CDS:2 [Ambispora leptoticha]|uniref:14055_t:CDS:1 n=1 Tax=Ambispora leptoticha TaxID=144679 RepID=A0A9N9A9A8_9GLOM|nr:14055_t:CDS:2 [Ambispora leptoticha]